MKNSDLKTIIKLPNNHLRQKSKPVGIVSNRVKQLIRDMEKATLNWEDSREHEVGVALAAVQIDSLTRVVVIRNDFNNKGDRTFKAYINPKIVKMSHDIVEDYEGCLSIEGVYGKVPRSSSVTVSALDPSGKKVSVTAKGFLARVFQHEIDHTDGIVFIDHIKDKSEAFYHLNEEGHLEPLDYEKDVRTNSLLW